MSPKKNAPPPAEGEEGEEGAAAEEGAEVEEEDDEPMTPRTLKKRVDALTDSITFEGFNYTRRGLFEQHKLLVATMLCLRILVRQKKIREDEMTALIKKEVALDPPNQQEQLKFIPETSWAAIRGLESV